MGNKTCFRLGNSIKLLNKINIQINLQNQKPFPKKLPSLRSHYQYRFRYLHLNDSGYVTGGLTRIVSSLIDFSFIRSLVCDVYSKEGAPPYDPVSLFLLDLFRYLNKYKTMKDFIKDLHDINRGRNFRLYAGISPPRIPVEADFSNFRIRLGEQRYNQIFHILVSIAQELGILTARILSHDASLYPAYARYRGCTFFTKTCLNITIPNLTEKLKNRVLFFLNNPEKIIPGKIHKLRCYCPNKENFPENVKPHTIEILSFSFQRQKLYQTSNDKTPDVLELKEELAKRNLSLKFHSSNVSLLSGPYLNDQAKVRCPKLPYDLDARIGYRRRKDNPNKKERVFGFKVIISTAIEPELGIELPVACINDSARAHESQLFPILRSQFTNAHPDLKPKLDIGDCGFDKEENYTLIRSKDSIPVIDYNPGNENLSPEALIKRGYDQNGWPYAPCQCLMRPNGFDKEKKQINFICAKQCLKYPIPKPISNCQYLFRSEGYSKHMSISQHPRLVNELIRGTEKYKAIRKLRPSSERINSTLKEDYPILSQPRTRGILRTSILAQMAVIVTFLSRLFNFIIRISYLLRKYRSNWDKKFFTKHLALNPIPAYLQTFLKRE